MKSICHRLLIKASAETVYNALTLEEGLSAWWTPETKAKPEAGSTARFAFGPDYFKEMKINYSILKLFTGFAIAALIAVYPTVSHAIHKEPIIVAAKNHTPIMIR